MAKKDFYVDINLNGNEIQQSTFEKLASAPINPFEGQNYYDTTLKINRQWNGSQWISGGGDSGGTQIQSDWNQTSNVALDYIKNKPLIPPDLSNSVTPQAIKIAYESNADTNAFTDAYETKLNAIQVGATANSSDATLLARVNHTGTQAATTINEDPTHRFTTDADKTSAGTVITNLALEITNRINADFTLQTNIDNAVASLLDGVATPGNTLQKLYNLILGSFQEITVPDIATRNAYNAVLGMHIFVTDDGDTRWALYKAISAGINATYIKLSDPDLLNALMSASQVKIAYESNADTNAFTNALKAKLDAISGTNSGNETVTSIGTLIHGATNKITPLDADEVPIWDSITGLLQKVSFTNLKLLFATLFLSKSNNLADVVSTGASRQNLNIPILFPARVAATANVASLSGTATIDGVALVVGNRAFLPFQTTGSQNGPWIVQNTAWTRPTDFVSGTTVSAHCIVIMGGSNPGAIWTMRNSVPIVIDTDAQTWGISTTALLLPGTGSRVAEADATGNLTATKTIIDQIVTDTTLVAGLQTTGNWTGSPGLSFYNSSALGSPGLQGQMYFGNIGAIPYWFFCKQDGLWIRESLTDIKQAAEGGTGIGSTILATPLGMVRVNTAGTAFENAAIFFNQSLRTNDSPTFVSFTMAGNLTLGLTSTASVSASTNNYNGLSVNNIFRFSSTAAWNITGLVGGTLGRVYIFTNVGSFNLTFTNEDAASTAANRFNFSSGVNMVLPPLATMIIYYDSTTARWRDMAYAGGITHLVGVTATPAIAAGTGAGTTPTVAIVGNDIAGKITVTTGTLPTAAATVVTVTFAVPFASGAIPKVILSAHNALAAALSGVTMVFAAGESNTSFTITAGATGLSAATAYEWNYHIIQ